MKSIIVTATLLLFSQSALADEPSGESIALTYSATFDLTGGLESIACKTGLCDCDGTYEGSGKLVSSDGTSKTYKGSFKQTSGKCHDSLTFWSADSGTAYHTITFSEDGSSITSWVAHGKEKDTRPFSESKGIKENQQCYLTEISAQKGAERIYKMSMSDSGKAGPFDITSSHALTVEFK